MVTSHGVSANDSILDKLVVVVVVVGSADRAVEKIVGLVECSAETMMEPNSHHVG